jgi:hypothetical protein
VSKLITFFLFVFIGAAILSGIMEGGGGIQTTELTAAIDDDDTILTVTSTDGFLDADYLIIGTEKILYDWTDGTHFGRVANPCTRGYDGTTATSHAADAMVMTADASTVNNALGFNIGAMADSMGLWSVVIIPFYFLTKTLPRIVMMNFSFLSGQLAIIGWFFFAAGAGLIITLALYLAGSRRV